mgnify:FL=1
MNVKPMDSINKFYIEKANILHARVTWEWRNDDETRSLSRTPKIITWEEHKKWFKDSLEDPCKFLYLGISKDSSEKKSIGILRFELINLNKSHYEVSINISPIFRGKGYGSKLLSSGISLFSSEIRNKSLIFAEIKKNNHRSSNLFISAGFLPCPSTKEGFHMYALEVS